MIKKIPFLRSVDKVRLIDIVDKILHSIRTENISLLRRYIARLVIFMEDIPLTFSERQSLLRTIMRFLHEYLDKLLFHDIISKRFYAAAITSMNKLGGPSLREFAKIKKAPEKVKEKDLEKIRKIGLEPDHDVLFFLGAGASKPHPSNIPTVNELLDELWKKSNRLESKPLSKLEKWCEENNIRNIEELLTAVTLSDFMIRNPKNTCACKFHTLS